MSEQANIELYEALMEMSRRASGLKKMDGRKLLWLAKKFKVWGLNDCDIFSIESDIVSEIERRLYPEYDGERVTYQEWGWQTYEGEIRYLTFDDGRMINERGS